MGNPVLKRYFLEENYNCAEAMLRTANECLQLGLSEESLRMAGGFGGGMGAGGACGALCGAIQALSAMMLKDQESGKAAQCPQLRAMCAAYYKAFAGQLGSSECSELTPKYKKPDIRCYELMEKAWELLEETAAQEG